MNGLGRSIGYRPVRSDDAFESGGRDDFQQHNILGKAHYGCAAPDHPIECGSQDSNGRCATLCGFIIQETMIICKLLSCEDVVSLIILYLFFEFTFY